MVTIARINDLMKEINIKKSNLEKSCGLANGIILKWEKGLQNPSADAIVEIAKFFKTTTDYLLGLSNERVSPCFGSVHAENSAVAQGYGSTAVNGHKDLPINTTRPSHQVVDGISAEILKMLNNLSTKDKAAVLTFICELEEEEKKTLGDIPQ